MTEPAPQSDAQASTPVFNDGPEMQSGLQLNTAAEPRADGPVARTDPPRCPVCEIGNDLTYGVDWFQCLRCGRKWRVKDGKEYVFKHPMFGTQSTTPHEGDDVEPHYVNATSGAEPQSTVAPFGEVQAGEHEPHDPSGDIVTHMPGTPEFKAAQAERDAVVLDERQPEFAPPVGGIHEEHDDGPHDLPWEEPSVRPAQ